MPSGFDDIKKLKNPQGLQKTTLQEAVNKPAQSCSLKLAVGGNKLAVGGNKPAVGGNKPAAGGTLQNNLKYILFGASWE